MKLFVDHKNSRKSKQVQMEKLIEKAEQKTEDIIKEYNEGVLEIIPGKTKEESREIKILQILKISIL